jgi:hypothetical protein
MNLSSVSKRTRNVSSKNAVSIVDPSWRKAKAYEKKWGALGQEKGGVQAPQPPPTLDEAVVDLPLANLIRTVITVALTKSPLSLVPALIKLQRANQANILEMQSQANGIHQLLHAAAMVLKRRQNERLCAAGIFER